MTRILTALILGSGAFAVIWFLPAWCFNLMMITFIMIALWEFGQMFFSDSLERSSLIPAGAIICYAVLTNSEWLGLILIAITFIFALLVMYRSKDLANSASRLGLAVFSQIYIPAALTTWCLLREPKLGSAFVLLAVVPAGLTDTLALVFGKLWGKRKFSPLVSPNKTWMGYFGGYVGSLLGLAIVWFFTLQEMIPSWHLPLLGAAICITVPFGDLIESMLKRSAGVKDSGSIIPGHGGVLDRMDALIFTGPLMLIYTKYFI